MSKRTVLTIMTALIAAAATLSSLTPAVCAADNGQKAPARPSTAVSATQVKSETWHPVLESVGNVVPVKGVDVSNEVSGIVTRIKFKSGDKVKQGSELITLDSAQDEAKVRQLQADETLAKIQYSRQRQLYRTHSTSKSNVDQAKAQYEQAQAKIDEQRILLKKKSIHAPFDGVLGIRQVNLGQYLSPGTTIVTLQALKPLYINFSLPQQDLPKVKVGQSVTATVNAYENRKFMGKINAINPKVNENTRNFQIQANFSNKYDKLRPGMFVDVRVILPKKQNVITLPQTAITYNPYGDSIFVIHKANGKNGQQQLTVQSTFVQTGATRGDQVAIVKGVKEGDTVVTSGQLKLRNGMAVHIDNSNPPDNNPSPSLEDN